MLTLNVSEGSVPCMVIHIFSFCLNDTKQVVLTVSLQMSWIVVKPVWCRFDIAEFKQSSRCIPVLAAKDMPQRLTVLESIGWLMLMHHVCAGRILHECRTEGGGIRWSPNFWCPNFGRDPHFVSSVTSCMSPRHCLQCPSTGRYPQLTLHTCDTWFTFLKFLRFYLISPIPMFLFFRHVGVFVFCANPWSLSNVILRLGVWNNIGLHS